MRKVKTVNFTVNFRNHYGDTISAPNRGIGLVQLDAARRIFGVPNLLPARVQGHVISSNVGGQVEIALEMARVSGHFDECNEVEVQLSNSEEYCMLRPDAIRDDATGEIVRVQFSWAMDEEVLLADWQGAGFPLDWDRGVTPSPF